MSGIKREPVEEESLIDRARKRTKLAEAKRLAVAEKERVKHTITPEMRQIMADTVSFLTTAEIQEKILEECDQESNWWCVTLPDEFVTIQDPLDWGFYKTNVLDEIEKGVQGVLGKEFTVRFDHDYDADTCEACIGWA